MKVYWVNTDIDKYQHLVQDLEITDVYAEVQRREILSCCQPVTEPLTPPDVYSPTPKLKRGDFWRFAAYSTFVLPPASVEKVRPFLEEAGELLPIPYQEEVFSVLNILKYADCVDPKTPNKSDILHLMFLADLVPSGIFRISPGHPYIFVSETTGDPATEFKAFVEHEGMKGLIFREIWTDES